MKPEMNAEPSGKPARRYLVFAYGAAVYGLFLVTFMYMMGFVGDVFVPRTVNTGGRASSTTGAFLINAGLLSLFVIQHTIMARRGFKQWWTRIVPAAIERSTFVLATCAVLWTLIWQWRPIPGVAWQLEHPALRFALHALYAGGWLLVLYSSFLIDHFELFGLRQVVMALRGRPHPNPVFVTPWLYRLVRNPLMLGFLIAFWSRPTMTFGSLQFAMMTTAYIFFGVWMEERSLLATLGDEYRKYRERTPMLLPRLRPPRADADQVQPVSVLPDFGTRD